MKSLFLVTLLFCASALSENLAFVKDPKLDKTEFKAQLLIDQRGLPLADYLAKNLVEPGLKQNLKTTFLNAQTQFLGSDLEKSYTSWQQVVSYAYKANWAETERHLISVAYFRLAQLSQTPAEQSDWLKQAFAFDDRYKPDYKLIPPPIVSEFNYLKANGPRVSINIEVWQKYDVAVINGVKYNIEKGRKLILSQGTKYLSLLSSTFAPIHKVISTESLDKFDPSSTAFILSDCEKPNSLLLREDLRSKVRLEVISDKKCYAESAEQNLAMVGSQPSQTNFNGTPSIENTSVADKNSGKAFYQKPNFWLGTAAALAAVLIIKNNRDQDNNSPPTHKEGF